MDTAMMQLDLRFSCCDKTYKDIYYSDQMYKISPFCCIKLKNFPFIYIYLGYNFHISNKGYKIKIPHRMDGHSTIGHSKLSSYIKDKLLDLDYNM